METTVWAYQSVYIKVHYRESRLGVALLALSPHLSRLVLDHLNGLDTGDLRYALKMYSIVQRGQSEIQLTCLYIVQDDWPALPGPERPASVPLHGGQVGKVQVQVQVQVQV